MSDFANAVGLFERAVSRTVATCSAIAPDRWLGPSKDQRICDIVEHMALSNDRFAQRLQALAQIQAGAEPCAELDDEEVPFLFERAPEPPGLAEPTGTWLDRDESLGRFAESAQPVIALSGRAVGDMRRKGAPHPLFGVLDGVQWAVFAAAHTERHRSEIVGLLG